LLRTQTKVKGYSNKSFRMKEKEKKLKRKEKEKKKRKKNSNPRIFLKKTQNLETIQRMNKNK